MDKKIKSGLIGLVAVCMVGAVFTGTVFAKDAKIARNRKDQKPATKIERVELTDEQKAEMKAKCAERLAKMVADGKITQEEADKMLADFDAGKRPMMGEPQRGGKFQKGQMPERPELTDEQKAEMKAKCAERLAKMVADGKITQEEADKMLADFDAGKRPMMSRGQGCGMPANAKTVE